MKPDWLLIAEGEVGQHEEREGENSHILEYHSTTSLRATTDEVPWCSSFVNWCLIKAGFKGTNSAAAKSWLKWGVSLATPTEGCICIIKKKVAGEDSSTGSSSGYHVGFWLDEDADILTMLGGNQSDQVKVSRFKKASYNVLGYKVPRAPIQKEAA